eukprot:TRINITY_DN55994_c0_g1_i1.p1 TRINITY_DN55994_c0_g1~~TRINITY_DN55994_c0_g1_i1.p1  ORF type:complete len:190 (-),score=31.13 TRINITY_DN55994_c0_g1_i1:379-948(-)
MGQQVVAVTADVLGYFRQNLTKRLDRIKGVLSTTMEILKKNQGLSAELHEILSKDDDTALRQHIQGCVGALPSTGSVITWNELTQNIESRNTLQQRIDTLGNGQIEALANVHMGTLVAGTFEPHDNDVVVKISDNVSQSAESEEDSDECDNTLSLESQQFASEGSVTPHIRRAQADPSLPGCSCHSTLP